MSSECDKLRNAINQVSACSVPDAIPHRVGDAIQAKNPERGREGVSGAKLQESRKFYPDWEYIAIGIAVDHVHIHMVIPPKYAVSKVVETLKKNTSRHLSLKFRFLVQVYWDREGIWSKGFFASTVGINEAVIKKYVEMQEKEDTGQTEFEW